MQNLSCDNEFDLHEKEDVGGTRFDTETKGNSEMAYEYFSFSCVSKSPVFPFANTQCAF